MHCLPWQLGSEAPTLDVGEVSVGTPLSLYRRERLSPLAVIRSTVKIMPMTRPCGRSMQFSASVKANTTQRSAL
jgi:hypothetical protein